MIRRISTFLIAFSIIILAVGAAQAQSQPLLTRHVRDVVVHGQAQSAGHLPANQTMRLELVLGLRHQAELEDFLHELYTPSSPLYRKFLTVEEFTGRFGPSQQDYDAVVRFAKENGLTVASTSRNRMNVGVTGTVASIENAFHVTLGIYQHPTEHRTFYAPDQEPTVDLPFKLWNIAGLDNYSIPHSLLVHRDAAVKSNATTGSGPSASFLGSDMRAAYYGGTALTGAGQSLGLLEYLGTDLDDLNTYYANVGQTLNVPITLLSRRHIHNLLCNRRLQRHGTDPGYDPGAWHGAWSGQPGDVCGIDRCGGSQRHGHGQPAECAAKFLLDLGRRRSDDRRPVF